MLLRKLIMNKPSHSRQIPLAQTYENQIFREEFTAREKIMASQCKASLAPHHASAKAGIARARSSAAQAVDADNLVYVATYLPDNPGKGTCGLTLTIDGITTEQFDVFEDVTGPGLDLESVIAALRAVESLPGTAAILTTARSTVEAINHGQLIAWEECGWERSNGEPLKHCEALVEILRLCRAREVAITWLRQDASPPMKRAHQVAKRAFRARKVVCL